MNEHIALASKSGTMLLRASDMAIVSYQAASGQEFICDRPESPAFILGYYDEKRRYRNVPSQTAQTVRVEVTDEGDARTVRGEFTGIDGMDITVVLTAYASLDGEYIDFEAELENRGDVFVMDLQYPYVLCRSSLDGEAGSETVVLPHGYGSGKQIKNAGKSIFTGFSWVRKLQPDSCKAWEYMPLQNNCNHYPGTQFAQFMYYHNDRGGLYLCCDDTQGNVKRFLPLDRGTGLRLGVSHAGDWPARGRRKLEYRTRVTSMEGDWYEAAERYREWFRQTPWFTPLRTRGDAPQWLIDSPVYVTIRLQGLLDVGPAEPIEAFLPYEKCMPLLEGLARQVDSPLSVVLMCWEKNGPWTYPDTFPPIGGEESMRGFIAAAREKGWRVGTFSNGTRWVFQNLWTQSDGYDFYDREGGDESACRQADGQLWHDFWDWSWRPSVAACIAHPITRKLAKDFVDHITGWGMESIQFLDQNSGSASFPCFSDEHGHARAPGKWMYEGMTLFMNELRAAAHPGLEPIHSAESGLNECCIPLFQETELRLYPPGVNDDVIPLYQYLFHDCVILHAMMGFAPEPYHLILRNATAFIYGEIPGGVLRGDGLLLDKDTANWAEWTDPVENMDNAYRMIRQVNALRRSDMRDFLVYGRMLRPAQSFETAYHSWSDGRNVSHTLAAVFHAVWEADDGRAAMAMVNWTDTDRTVTVRDERFNGSPLTLVSARDGIRRDELEGASELLLTLPAISCCVLTARKKSFGLAAELGR